MSAKAQYLRKVKPGALVAVVGAPELKAKVVRVAEGSFPNVTVRVQGGLVERVFLNPQGEEVRFEVESGRTLQWSGGTRVLVLEQDE